MTACCLLLGYLCVCVPVCVCLAHCQVASSQITLWAAAALRHRSQRSIYSKTFTPSPRTKTNSINLCYLRVHMINCCDTSVCDVEAVVANVSWQADRLWRYWHILHGASNKPTNFEVHATLYTTLLLWLKLQPRAEQFRNISVRCLSQAQQVCVLEVSLICDW